MSGNGRERALLVHFGDGSPARVYREKGDKGSVLGPEANVRAGGVPSANGGPASWLGDKLLVITYQGAPRGRLLALDKKGGMQQLVAEQKWAMHGVYAIQGGFC